MLPGVHHGASLAQRWLLSTHQGGVKPGHIQAYLDEFAFRSNRRRSRTRGMLFYRLLEQAVQAPPRTYRSLVVEPGSGRAATCRPRRQTSASTPPPRWPRAWDRRPPMTWVADGLLAATPAAAGAHGVGARIGVPDAARGWVPAQHLARDPDRLRGALERAAAALGTTRADIGATRLCEVWTWNLAVAAATTLLLLDVRLPDLRAPTSPSV